MAGGWGSGLGSGGLGLRVKDLGYLPNYVACFSGLRPKTLQVSEYPKLGRRPRIRLGWFAQGPYKAVTRFRVLGLDCLRVRCLWFQTS